MFLQSEEASTIGMWELESKPRCAECRAFNKNMAVCDLGWTCSATWRIWFCEDVAMWQHAGSQSQRIYCNLLFSWKMTRIHCPSLSSKLQQFWISVSPISNPFFIQNFFYLPYYICCSAWVFLDSYHAETINEMVYNRALKNKCYSASEAFPQPPFMLTPGNTDWDYTV